MQRSDSIKEIATALAKFQAEVKNPANSADNPFFKSKYAPLNEILNIVRPILAKNGLSVLQMPGGDSQETSITTLLMHESGEWIESEPLTMKAVKNDPQGAGSVITYARRYSLSAILGISSEDDDDANHASGNNSGDSSSKKKTPATPPQTKPQGASSLPNGKVSAGQINDIQKARIQELAKAVGKTGIDITDLCKREYKKQYSQLTEAEAGEIIATLQIELDRKTAELEPPSTPLPDTKQEDLFSGAKMPEKTMKAIHARAAEIGMNHDDLSSYAQCQYPVKSLTELNEEQGKALLADLKALPDLDKAVGA